MKTMTIVGNVGADAELKTLPSGSTVLEFRVGVSVRGQGQGERDTNWVNCKVWGKRAESLAQYLTKGKKVVASGDQLIRTYQGRDGQPGFSEDLDVQEIDFFDVAPRQQRQQGGYQGQQQGGYQGQQQGGGYGNQQQGGGYGNQQQGQQGGYGGQGQGNQGGGRW